MHPTFDREINFEVVNRFYQNCMRGKENEHWLWTAGSTYNGYGCFTIKKIKYLAHRVSYLHFNNLKKIDLLILHKPECNTKICCNPNHLYAGDQQDNINDQLQLGTFIGYNMIGEAYYKTNFTEADIIKIRSEYNYYKITYAQLGKRYNVDPTTIRDIIKHKTWKHVK
jgi:hypothetical protein